MKEPKHCPFCGEPLVLESRLCRAIPGEVYLKLWKHPKSNCYASLFEVTVEDLPLWNRRTP